MSAVALFFYLFSGVALASAFMVVVARNPVHSVLFLILTFVNAAGLFLLMGAEFLAMILIVVYVGAVAVLFLFVVMMLDVDFAALRQGFINYLPLGALVGAILAIELILVVGTWTVSPDLVKTPAAAAAAATASVVTNTQAIGQVLYTRYIYFFQTAGLVLLVAMIGAIVLTLRERVGVRRQDVAQQVARTRDTAMAVRKVASGETGLGKDAA